MLTQYDPLVAEEIHKAESMGDHYEDILGTYLVKLCSYKISDEDSTEVSKLLKAIGDFERISDHSMNILESAEELKSKNILLTDAARRELDIMCSAVSEVLTLSYTAFVKNDLTSAEKVEPLEQVIDGLKIKLRNGHIERMRAGKCSIEAGFVWADLVTNLERTADHCSNIAICVLDANQNNMNIHQTLRNMKKGNAEFDAMFAEYAEKYSV